MECQCRAEQKSRFLTRSAGRRSAAIMPAGRPVRTTLNGLTAIYGLAARLIMWPLPLITRWRGPLPGRRRGPLPGRRLGRVRISSSSRRFLLYGHIALCSSHLCRVSLRYQGDDEEAQQSKDGRQDDAYRYVALVLPEVVSGYHDGAP